MNFVRGAHRRLQLMAGTQDGPPRRDVSSQKLASLNCRLPRVPRSRAVRCNLCARRRPPLRSTSFPGSAFCDNVLTPTSPPCRQQPLGNPAVVLIHGRGTHFSSFLVFFSLTIFSFHRACLHCRRREERIHSGEKLFAAFSRTCICSFLFFFDGC